MPRFSYGRDFRPSGVFSYTPAFWGAPRHGRDSEAKVEAAKTQGMIAGEAAGRSQAMMVGGAVLGVAAVGALIWVAAKK